MRITRFWLRWSFLRRSGRASGKPARGLFDWRNILLFRVIILLWKKLKFLKLPPKCLKARLTFLQALKALRQRAHVVLRNWAHNAIPKALLDSRVREKLGNEISTLLFRMKLNVLKRRAVRHAFDLLEFDLEIVAGAVKILQMLSWSETSVWI